MTAAGRRVLLFALLFLVSSSPVWPHADRPSERTGRPEDRLEIAENLGSHLPLDTSFRDDQGNAVTLRELIRKPTIIAPVYLSCAHACPMLLGGLADVLGRLTLSPGKDYQVLTFSFDDRDTPALALEKKQNYLKAVGRNFPAEAWRFITGDATNIGRITEKAGFVFRREKEGFSHPLVLIVVAPDGKIVRYLYGSNFLPFDLSMALAEAAEGRVGSTTRRLLMYCYSYDPLSKTYVFSILKVVGVAMVLFVGTFLAYLLLSGKNRQQAR